MVSLVDIPGHIGRQPHLLRPECPRQFIYSVKHLTITLELIPKSRRQFSDGLKLGFGFKQNMSNVCHPISERPAIPFGACLVVSDMTVSMHINFK